METLLLDDDLFVQERYEEIHSEKKRYEGYSLRHQSNTLEARRENVMSKSQVWEQQVSADEEDALSRIRELDTVWSVTLIEKKVMVMGGSLEELTVMTRRALGEKEKLADDVDTTESSPSESRQATKFHDPAMDTEDTAPKRLEELPIASQLSLKLFFRICASLRTAGKTNGRLLSMMASKIPPMLDNLPAIPLVPDMVDTASRDPNRGSPAVTVFQELLSVYGGLLGVKAQPSETGNENERKHDDAPNDAERANVVMAYVAISLKSGRLRDILQATLILIQQPNLLSTQHIEPLHKQLLELSTTQASIPAQPLLQDDASPVGYLVSFGKGDHGKLGHGQCSHTSCSEGNCTENKNVPTVLASTRDVKFVKIDSLSTHSIAITTKGEVMAWGNGDKYRLGHGTTSKEYAPRIIDSLSLKGKVSDIACGLGHTTALMTSGDIYAWGNGSNGRLGLGDTNDRSSPTKVPIPDESALRSTSSLFRNVMCGASHSLALTCDGRAFSWGKNNQGQCGLGHTNDQLVVAEVTHFRDELGEQVTHASGGWEHTLFCSASGRVYSCGCGYKDSRRTGIPPVLGHGDCERRLKPAVIQSLVDANEEIVRVSCGWDHSLAVSAEGALYTWGSGTNGKLGHGDEETCEVPTVVRALSGKIVNDAKAGCEHTVAITDDHEVWTFGQGDSGRLGLGDTSTRTSPSRVEFFERSGLVPVAIAVGDKYNLVLVEDAGSPSHQADGTVAAKRSSPTRARFDQPHGRQSELTGANRPHRQHSTMEALKRKAGGTPPIQDLAFCGGGGRLSAEAKNPGPITQAELVQFIASHLARISTEYLAKCMDDERVRSPSPRKSTVLLPFGVDASVATMELLVQLIGCSQDLAKTQQKEQVFVVLACLRVLAVNVSYWTEPPPTESCGDDNSTLFGRVHDAVNTFASNGLSQHGDAGDFGDPGLDHMGQLDAAIRQESALILKIGFSLFYPSRAHRVQLLWELVSSSDGVPEIQSLHRAQALTAKLSEDLVMNEIVRGYFEQSRFHACTSGSQDVPSELDANAVPSLERITKVALEKCCSYVSNGLEASATEQHPDPTIAAVLQILGVLQAHWFAVASCSMSPTHADAATKIEIGDTYSDPSVCSCAANGLLAYLDLLYDSSLVVVKKLHKMACQGEELGIYRARRSILDLVLLPAVIAIHAIVAARGERFGGGFALRLIERLLPRAKALLVVVDELSWRDKGAGNVFPAVQPQSWIVELGDACALLCGEMTSFLMRPSLSFPESPAIEAQLRVLVGAPSEILAIGERLPPRAVASILKWSDVDDAAQEHRTVDSNQGQDSYSDVAWLADQDFLMHSLDDQDRLDQLQSLIAGYRQQETVDSCSRVGLNSSRCRIRDYGFVAIVWFAGITANLRESSSLVEGKLEANPVKTTSCHAFSSFESSIAIKECTDAEVSHALRQVKVLLRFKSSCLLRLSTPSSLRQWITALRHVLLSPSSPHTLVASLSEYMYSPTLFEVGVKSFTDMLHQANSRRIKSALLQSLFKGTVARHASHSLSWISTPTCGRSIENLGYQLVSSVTMEELAIAAKAKALGVWLWIFHSDLVRAADLAECIGRANLIPQLGSILIRGYASKRVEPLDPPTPAEQFSKSKAKRQIQRSQKLRPVEELLSAGQSERSLFVVAFEVFSAAVDHLCFSSSSNNTVESPHPLFCAASLSIPTDSSGSATHRPSSSPRRCQSLPKKSAVLSVQESIQMAYVYLMKSLEIEVDGHEAARTVVSPLLPALESEIPPTPLLLASPISVSGAKSYIGKALRVMLSSRTLSSETPTALQSSIHAVSFWMYVDEPPPSSESTKPDVLVNLVAVGEMTDRLQESAPSGSTPPLEIEATDRLRLVVFALKHGRDGDGCHSFGFACDVSSCAGSPPQWVAFVSTTQLHKRNWMHVTVSVAENLLPLMFVNGQLTTCQPVALETLQRDGAMATELGSFGKLNARVQIVCGGSLSEKFRDQLGLAGVEKKQDPDTTATQTPSRRVDIFVDDVWMHSGAVGTEAARKLYDQGPTVVQIKREHESEGRLLGTLRLLSKMQSLMPIGDAQNVSAPTNGTDLGTGLVELLLRLLRPCRGDVAYEITLLVIELLEQVLPCCHFSEPSCAMLDGIVDCLHAQRPRSNDLRTQLSILYSNGTRAGVQFSSVVTSQAAMSDLVMQHGITKLASAHANDSNDHSSRSIHIHHWQGRDVVSASVGELLQKLRATPAWTPLFAELLEETMTQLQAMATLSVDHDRSRTGITLAVLVAGNSELFLNELKLGLMIAKPSLKCIKWMQTLDAPWTSMASGVSLETGSSEWLAFSCQFGFSLLDERLRLIDPRDQHRADLQLADVRVVRMAELQTKILRSLAFVSLSSSTSARSGQNRLLSNATAVDALIRVCVMPVRQLIRHRLGSDATLAGKLRSVRLFGDALVGGKARSNGHSTMLVQDELEPLVAQLSSTFQSQQHVRFERDSGVIDRPPPWRSPQDHRASPLELLGGEAVIRGFTVQAVQHFPTIRLGRVAITANSGLWYYEVVVLSDGLMQIGYVDIEFVADAVQGQGVGDQTNSWAFDGYRCKKWNVSSVDYGDAWQAGDVVGVLLDTDRMELSYFLNRKFLGVAFSNLPLTSATSMHPAVSLNADQRIRFDFGRREALRATDCSDSHVPLQLPQLESPLDQQRLQAVVYGMDDLREQTDDELMEETDSDQEIESDDEEEDGDQDGSLDDGCGAEQIDDLGRGAHDLLPGKLSDETISIYHRSDLHQSHALPGTMEIESLSVVDSSDGVHPNPRRDVRREDAQDDDYGTTRAHVDTSTESNLTTRQANLIIELVALGFPHAWAIRCAHETSFTVNDTGAVSWILEQMERDATSSVLQSFADMTRCDTEDLADSVDASLPAIPRRAQDDSSLLPSSVVTTGSGTIGKRTWQLSLSPTRDGRPYTEHQVRSRVLDLSPTKPPPSEPSDSLEHSVHTNPFLASERHDDDDGDDAVQTEGSLALSASESHRFYQDCVEQFLYRLCLGAKDTAEDMDRSKSKDVINQRKASRCPTIEDDDLVPACVAAQSLLSVCYTRLIAQSLLFGESSDVTKTYPIVVQWIATGDRRNNLFTFIRKQLQLDLTELPIAVDRAAAHTRDRPFESGMTRLLRYETSHSTTELPLLQTVLKEIGTQVRKAVRRVTRFRRTIHPPPKAMSEALTLAMNARWTLWLFTVVQQAASMNSAVEIATAMSQPRDAVHAFVSSRAFIDDVITLASPSSGASLPWQTAAFHLIQIAMSILSTARTDISDESIDAGSELVPLEYLVELLARTLAKERPRSVAFSERTKVLFEIALRHVPISTPPIMVKPSVSVPSREVASMRLCVEQLTSSHATISWKCLESPATAILTTDEEVKDDEDQHSNPIESHTLSLEVTPRMPRVPPAASTPSWFSSGVLSGIPHSLPLSGSLVLRHLAPDSWYTIRLLKSSRGPRASPSPDPSGETQPTESEMEVLETSIRTPPEQVVELSSDACGSNLVLLNRNRTVKNQVNKKWNTVRASVAFDEGIHHWHIRIDTCVSKNIFIGICTADASLDNYIGSDAYGYGFLANKAVWHNKSKLQSYGEIFKQGDLIHVALDCNARTLSYSRNGEFLGVAATNLHVGTGNGNGTGQAGHKWYPAVSLYNKDDQLTLVVSPPSLSSSSSARVNRPRSQFTSVLEFVDSARLAIRCCIANHQLRTATTESKTPTQIDQHAVISDDAFIVWQKWKHGELCWREVALGDVVQIDANRDTVMDLFGFAPGDSVFTSHGHCVVLGVAKHELWYEVSDVLDSHTSDKAARSVGSWSLYTCREMLEAPDDYPVHRSRRQYTQARLELAEDEIAEGGEIGMSQEMSEVSTDVQRPEMAPEMTRETFEEIQHKLTGEKLDLSLLLLVDALAQHRGFKSPQQLTFTDVSSALVLHDIVDVLQSQRSPDVLHQEELLVRLATLLDLNQHVYRVVRLFLATNSDSSCSARWDFGVNALQDHVKRSSSSDQATHSQLLATAAARLAASIGVGLSSRDVVRLPPTTPKATTEVLADRREIVRFLCAHLFASQREKLIAEALRRTVTPTMTPSSSDSKASDLGAADDATQNEPKEMLRIQIQVAKSEPVAPFWRSSCLTPAPPFWMVRSDAAQHHFPPTRLFAQLSKQLTNVAPHELRREFVSSADLLARIPRTFHIASLDASETDPSSVAADQATDQLTQYLKLFDDVFTEIQSPMFPLFVPTSASSSSCDVWDVASPSTDLELDVNAHLVLPEFGARCGIRVEQALLWFYQVGQLLGLVWRARTIVPLQFITQRFWRSLLCDDDNRDGDGSDGDGDGSDRVGTGRIMAIRAVRDGLTSIIPFECLQLSTPETLHRRLSDRDVFCIDKLHRHAIFDRHASHHRLFWSVVRGFSSLERRFLIRFLRGKSTWRADGDDDEEDPIENWKRRVRSSESSSPSIVVILELAEPLADALAHPDACFPVVVVDALTSRCHISTTSTTTTTTTSSSSRLHLPVYTSASALRQKLLCAMHDHIPPN